VVIMHVSDHIRSHLLESLGVDTRRRLPSLDNLLRTEWCEDFERARRYRLVMGAFRYGLLSDPKGKYDLLGGLRMKLRQYEQTGNTEALVDAANYLMLEFMWPSHSDAHFQSKDDHCHCPRTR